MGRMKDLFGDEVAFPREARHLTRPTDPQTSFEAAESIVPKLSTLQDKVYEVILASEERGLTAWEVESYFGDHGSTYRTRISELCGKGPIGMRVTPPIVVDS